MRRGRGLVEYDLHPRGTNVDMALARLEQIVSAARASGHSLFAVITGYGSSGGTSLIKEGVLAACRRYRAQNHIRGFLVLPQVRTSAVICTLRRTNYGKYNFHSD